jgi:hypothetical protein
MYTPGMMRHAIEELRNLGYTAEQARFIIRNCGTGAGGFGEGNDCAKGKAGKDGDGDGEFEGDKGGGGGKGGKPRQTEGTSEEVSGERAEIKRILDQAPRVAEVQKGIEETKKKIKNLRRSYKKNPDPDKVREEKAEIKKLFALEAEAEGLPDINDLVEAGVKVEEEKPARPKSRRQSGKPRKKRSFSHRLMELRKAGLPISVAIRMSREDGDD